MIVLVRGHIRSVVLLGCVVLIAGCRYKPPPIRVEEGKLVVENQTRQEWRDISVTVNAYYRGVSPTLAPGGRLEAPLSNFVTGLGQRFDRRRESIRTVEVRATDAAGKPVQLDWKQNKQGPP